MKATQPTLEFYFGTNRLRKRKEKYPSRARIGHSGSRRIDRILFSPKGLLYWAPPIHLTDKLNVPHWSHENFRMKLSFLFLPISVKLEEHAQTGIKIAEKIWEKNNSF